MKIVPQWIGKVQHGPQSWPLWRIASFLWHPVGGTGRRLWVYTRWGAMSFDVHSGRYASDCVTPSSRKAVILTVYAKTGHVTLRLGSKQAADPGQ